MRILLIITWIWLLQINEANVKVDDRQTLRNQHILNLATPTIQFDNEDWSKSSIRRHLQDALEVMQNEYFQVWIGQWPTSIDWTGAVLATHIAATLNILTRSEQYNLRDADHSCKLSEQHLEHRIDYYFAQLTAYYFGEDAFAIRTQAHDDMLWVVLGWLESLKLIDLHDTLHHSWTKEPRPPNAPLDPSHCWHGTVFTPAFAHRARVFYDIVSQAWDRSLCGGGLTWNPRLLPYKNTVTNTQFISAAVGMYLYHPGDSIDSPFLLSHAFHSNTNTSLPARPHDPEYLSLAKEAYTWLLSMNLTNARGLLIDGLHLQSRLDPVTGNITYGACDVRSEMIYSYNQGILLSGLRQLWEATGNTSYLADGHAIIRSVMSATGYDSNDTAWHGLGHVGIMADFCDPSATCSQDGQTFKGIFFHHLALFCEPLPTGEPLLPGKTFVADDDEAVLHANGCRGYLDWVEGNARAAWETRDGMGIMGMWWAAGKVDVEMPMLREGVVDWRNQGIDENVRRRAVGEDGDWNDRGRGRTVESHSGGLAVMRALYALKMFYD